MVDSWQELRFGSNSMPRYGNEGRIPLIFDFPDRTGRQIQQLTSGIVILSPIMRAQRIRKGREQNRIE